MASRLFGLINMLNGALRAPPPRQSQLRCSPKNKKIFQKQNASLLARTWASRGIYLSTFQRAKLHSSELHCTFPIYAAPPYLCCTLMSYPVPTCHFSHK